MSDICQGNINKWYDQTFPTPGHTLHTLDKNAEQKI